jgi:hypothetical protein
MKRLALILGLIIGVLGTAAVLATEFGPPSTLMPRDMAVNGLWALGTDTAEPERVMPWSVEVTREKDNSLHGTVSIAGMEERIRSGTLNGKLDWPYVAGTISDEKDAEVAWFEGEVTYSGVQGKFVTEEGETGAWGWEW